MIKLIVSALTAAGLALAANLALKRTGTRSITFFGPVLEESLKTGAAFFYGVSVPGTHLLFGVLESLADFAWGGRRKLAAALSGVVAHTVFGLVAYFLIKAGLPGYTAVLGSIAVHMAWNGAVIRISR